MIKRYQSALRAFLSAPILPSAVVLSLFLQATLLVGFAYQHYGSVLALFADGLTLLAVVAFLLLSFCLIYPALAFALRRIDRLPEPTRETAASVKIPLCDKGELLHSLTTAAAGFCADKAGLGIKRGILYGALILACWIPTALVFFPGNIAADGYWQIDFYFLGEVSPYDIHPPFSTYLIGWLYFTGEALGGVFAGVFLSTAVQGVLALASYTLVCCYLQASGVRRSMVVLVALFYGLVPLFCNVGLTIFKDSYYLSLFLLFQLLLIKTYRNFNVAIVAQGGQGTRRDSSAPQMLTEQPRRGVGALIQSLFRLPTTTCLRDLALLVLLGLSLCLFRKEAGFIIVLSMAALNLRFWRGYWRCLLPAFLAALLGLALLGQLGLTTSALNSRGVSLEMASIPLQQTARAVRDAPGDISQEEWAVLDEVFVYNQDIPIADKYDPELSDPIKGFNIYLSSEVVSRYASTYLSIGLRHPEIYLDAFLNQTYGYYSPLFNATSYYAEQSNGDGGTEGNYILAPQHLFGSEIREAHLAHWIALFQQPPLYLLWSGGFYAWLIAFLLTCLLHQRRFGGLVVFLPVLLVFCFCLISPVNGNMRYEMPLIAVAPLLLAFVCQRCAGDLKGDKGTADCVKNQIIAR